MREDGRRVVQILLCVSNKSYHRLGPSGKWRSYLHALEGFSEGKCTMKQYKEKLHKTNLISSPMTNFEY